MLIFFPLVGYRVASVRSTFRRPCVLGCRLYRDLSTLKAADFGQIFSSSCRDMLIMYHAEFVFSMSHGLQAILPG